MGDLGVMKMGRTYKIDYNQSINCFEKIATVKTELIWGDERLFQEPFISYIIPVYKRADLLKKTLDSIMKQIEVDFCWNIVIVDNEAGPENDVERLIRGLDCSRILYYRNQENIGVDGNYNRCIEMAKGHWLAMLHADDLIVNDHLFKTEQYINWISEQKDVRKLAYICQRYIDFSDEKKVLLDRNIDVEGLSTSKFLLNCEYTGGKPSLQPQSIGLLTGFYAAIPSFGTIMNREILMKEGGFNEELGICEDVIIPFKLAKHYYVYMAPVIMGFHRYEGNQSMKISTIKSIYSAMIDFREYMYSTMWWGKLWAFFSRDILNENLLHYCMGASRFSSRKLTREELEEIYPIKKVSSFKQGGFNFVLKFVNKRFELFDYKYYIGLLLDLCKKSIEEEIAKGGEILIYGAGSAARAIIPILKKRFPNIKLVGCAVTQMGKSDKIGGLRIRTIDKYQDDRENICVITATVLWHYQQEMNLLLADKGFNKVINLLED